MNFSKTKEKKNMLGWAKYLTFAFILLSAFFAFQMNGGEKVEAAGTYSFSYKVNGSNYAGNGNNKAAVGEDPESTSIYAGKDLKRYEMDAAGDPMVAKYSIQGTSITEKDAVSLTFTITYDTGYPIQSVVAFESTYTTAGNRNYDVYKKDKTTHEWAPQVEIVDSKEQLRQGKVVAAEAGCAVLDASSSELRANGGANTSLFKFCDDGNGNLTIQYVYTIRTAGYGEKLIAFAFYNDEPAETPIVTNSEVVPLVVSKPISKFEGTWNDGTNACGTTDGDLVNQTVVGVDGTHSSANTDTICVRYVNGTPTINATKMQIKIPMEAAYAHAINATDTTENIAAKNTIYAINTFTNDGATAKIKYYYHAFLFEPNTNSDGLAPGKEGNAKLDPSDPYVLYIMIDAKGSYEIHIKDIFGNTFSTADTISNGIIVEDVSKIDIITDFTNDAALSLMVATTGYDTDWQGTWKDEALRTATSVNFEKMVKDEVTIVIHVFQRVSIGMGVWDDESESIKKSPLGYKATAVAGENSYNAGNVKFWRVAAPTSDSSENDSKTGDLVCSSANAAQVCGSTDTFDYDNATEFGVASINNRIEIVVKSNGIYRIVISDNFGNKMANSSRVDVTVIDKTAPVISTGLSGGKTSINSFPYVYGGGELLPVLPAESGSLPSEYWKNAANYDNDSSYTIYYNVLGGKTFDYQDALTIAQIHAIDATEYYTGSGFATHTHEVNFNTCSGTSCNGAYVDPTSTVLGNRNSSGATAFGGSTSLHNYIINQNITSFTGGLIFQASDTDFVRTDYSAKYTSDTALETENNLTKFLTNATNFYDTTATWGGYFEIEFLRTANSDASICTVSLVDGSSSANKDCFNTINKYIDEVENFKMRFSVKDYLNHDEVSKITVEVTVIDTTAPGIINEIRYTNDDSDGAGADTGTICRLEIGNIIQDKQKILKCYGLLDGSTYNFKDNNGSYEANDNSVSNGAQYYAGTGADNYFNKIKLSIKEGTGNFEEITDASFPELNKSGNHELKIEIDDHWATKHGISGATHTNNKLTVYVNYYVNPRTLLVEPLANEKMYGEADPTFGYCVYVNNHNDTFNYFDNYFDSDFINTYFTNIYCTEDVFVDISAVERFNATNATAGSGYSYNQFGNTAVATGKYAKVNNTYIDLEGLDIWTLSYESSTTGKYYHVSGSDYIEIKSGYAYTDDTCLYLADTSTSATHMKTAAGNCVELSGNRYNKKYTKSANKVNIATTYTNQTFIKYNDDVIAKALITGDTFAGTVTRVESHEYNQTRYTTSNINNNVGLYNIVLGSLKINGDAAKNEDYLIRINTNYRAESRASTDPLYYSSGDPQTQLTSLSEDDDPKTESTVLYTIRQAILTISASGDTKKYGEQDPYTNKWQDTTTVTNSTSASYLGGYTVHGYRTGTDYNDAHASNIIIGVLRRMKGEHVGQYDICNTNQSATGITSDCTYDDEKPLVYSTTMPYYFAQYGRYDYTANSFGTAGLTIATNEIVSATDGIRLNRTTRNYAVIFISKEFKIEQTNLIIQPGINQGKEYSKDAYNDPLWQYVVYGEANVTATDVANSFNGFTETIADHTFTNPSLTSYPYNNDSGKEKDTEVYYARRKTAPSNATYKYTIKLDISSYTKYKCNGCDDADDTNDVYYEDASGTYVFAYGKYRSTSSAVGNSLTIEIIGKLVNQTYTLFGSATTNSGKVGGLEVLTIGRRSTGEQVGWYTYNAVTNTDITTNGVTQCTYDSNNIVSGYDGSNECRNYTVTWTDRPTKDVDNTTPANPIYVTEDASVNSTVPSYKPNGTQACSEEGAYSSKCTSNTTKIMFEIFKREIKIKFIEDKFLFTYGERYDYFDGGVRTFGGTPTYSYNTNENGIFNIKDSTSEGNIFLCYSDGDMGNYLVDCTDDPDYGLTKGDTWTNIGLKFYLHSVVSESETYYSSSSNASKAVPAGKYYVYAMIGATNDSTKNGAALQNYRFVYEGGTVTINPKVTNVHLTGYTMEYADPYYSSYGLGSDYSNYAVTTATCMTDAKYTSGTTLINDCVLKDDATKTANLVGNTYGFTIEGLDKNDTIANNFTGRPIRVGTLNAKGYLDVGYYKINVNNIANIRDLTVVDGTFKACESSSDDYKNGLCVFDSTNTSTTVGADQVALPGNNGVNYDIRYSLEHNEGAYLFVLPANLTITVSPDQTKMYGCAYHAYHTLADADYYVYTYDEAYKFHVAGDKDNSATAGGSVDYDVTSSVDSGTSKFTLPSGYADIFNGGNLYRISGTSYKDAKLAAIAQDYQKQAVGVYTISLGDLNAKDNSNTLMCDDYNNPVLVGGTQCRNYNINYYGENATDGRNDETSNDTHNYNKLKESVDVSKLVLYTIKYEADNTNGNYVLINGKYVELDKMAKYASVGATSATTGGEYVIINKYVLASSLQKYVRKAQYEVNSGGTYVNLDGSYVLASSLTQYAKSGDSFVETSNGGYILTNGKYIKLSSLEKFVKNYNDGETQFAEDNSGTYVKINNEYVRLASLAKYSESSGIYTVSSSGTYVQIYEYVKVSELSKYKINSESLNMYNANGSSTAKNVFAFVNGSYIPFSSVIATNIYDANFTTGNDMTDTVTNDVDFTITARIVYVHPEYNVKAYGDSDPVAYITCKEISVAYGITSQTEGRGYCANYNEYVQGDGSKTGAHIDLGVTMYYAVQNSLAKAPWTAWTDKGNSISGTYKDYNDIQFDVITGKVSRKTTNPERAGKFTFDFSGDDPVRTYDDYNGENYMIQYVVKGNEAGTQTYNYDRTFVKMSDDSYKKLSEVIYNTTCTLGSAHCVLDPSSSNASKGTKTISNGYKLSVDASGRVVSSGGTSTSISLIDKYYHDGSTYKKIDYWYLGFYKVANEAGRENELSPWWSVDGERVSTNATNPFTKPYDTFKNDSDADTSNAQFVSTREVYFEIIKRIIFLYAVDLEKTYGDADKYDNFKVAICPTSEGYIVGPDGKIGCVSNSTTDYGFGMSDVDKALFLDDDNYMKQDQIKNKGTATTYIFNGTPDVKQSFGIYFRRTPGENVGTYSVTACAIQTGVADCTHRPSESNPDYTIDYLADNYDVREIPGTLTINTRSLDITPDSDQGFEYGNYTENGSIPSIAFTEKHGAEYGLVNGGDLYLVNGTTYNLLTKTSSNVYTVTLGGTTYTIDGLKVLNGNAYEATINVSKDNTTGRLTKTVTINSTTYTLVQKSRCLVDISGLSMICINDAQNEALASDLSAVSASTPLSDDLLNKLYSYGASYVETISDTAKKNVAYLSRDVYGDTYSNSANANTRTEVTSGRSALNRTCGSDTDARYSREVCDGNYTITQGDLAINVTNNTNEFTVANNNALYVYIIDARRFRLDGTNYVQDDEGTYIKYADGKYYQYVAGTTPLYKRECTTSGSGATATVSCAFNPATAAEIAASVRFKYIKIDGLSGINYSINSFTENVEYSITVADLQVTPVEKQYKIYGEVDEEIQFTVMTTYKIERTQYQYVDHANIVSMCNGEPGATGVTCISGASLNAYRYNKNGTTGVYTQSDTGEYILVIKDWYAILDNYAYDEETDDAGDVTLDYGARLTKTKHADEETTTKTNVFLDGVSVTHYDAHTTYKNSTDFTTNRILIGNLYVEDKNQNAGEHSIKLGMKVTGNEYGFANYDLLDLNTVSSTNKEIVYVIVPRPINVQIENITKTYGEATDSTSCASGVSDCFVGEGILHSSAEDLLINNFTVITKDLTNVGIPGTAVTGGLDATAINTTNYTGLAIHYPNSATNMPVVVSAAFANTNEYYNYVTVDAGKYYTPTGGVETKNDNLDIEVQREAKASDTNLATNSACLTDAEGTANCEDAGEYYLKFSHRGTAKTASATVTAAYYSKYWGYNPNYYVIIYNNYEESNWDNDAAANQDYGFTDLDSNIVSKDDTINATLDANSKPTVSATLKIRKRAIQIVVETISDYTYTQNNSGTHLKVTAGDPAETRYFLISQINTFNKDGTKYRQALTGEGQYLYVGDFGDEKYVEITAANRYNLVSKGVGVGEIYSIEENMDVPQLPTSGEANDAYHHTTYNQITWYSQPMQVRVSDYLNGRVAYCQQTLTSATDDVLDTLRYSTNCDNAGKLRYYETGINDKTNASKFFDTSAQGYYIITRQTSQLYVTNTSGVSGDNGDYEYNNYVTQFVNGILKIDDDETAPVITVKQDFVEKEANGGKLVEVGTELEFLDLLKNNACGSVVLSQGASGERVVMQCDGVVFTYAGSGSSGDANVLKAKNKNITSITDSSGNDVLWSSVNTILDWFGISSFDPSVMRNGVDVGKRYDPRWYIEIQQDFNQRRTGDYSIFLYVQDDSSNISFASMVTLRVTDKTAPVTGTLNLYSAQVYCPATGEDCSLEDSWLVKNDVYLPIHTLTNENTSNMKAADKAHKYRYDAYTFTYVQDDIYGTYYKITSGSSAKAVKHSGWTNSTEGIYMTITNTYTNVETTSLGVDNSLDYLNTAIYDKYTVSGDVITESNDANGTHIFLGTFVNVRDVTKYRQFKVDGSGNESASGSTMLYMPSTNGTIIYYKGHYYNLQDIAGINAGYIGTAPTDAEYTLKLYEYDTTAKTYTPVTEIADLSAIPAGKQYFIGDGKLYELPSAANRYNANGQRDSSNTGTYINFAQWDHYYSLDSGITWTKYNRDFTEGQLVLGQDGQRLVMIKAIDTGYYYEASGQKTKNNMTAAYCGGGISDARCTTGGWQKVVHSAVTYTEASGTKKIPYNIALWETYVQAGNRDRKYAYLDTVIPTVTLTDKYIEIYEYGCASVNKCQTNHVEAFGTANDGYLLKLSNLVRYKQVSAGVYEFDTTGMFVNIKGQYISIENKITNVSGTDYVYVGVIDGLATADTVVATKIAARISGATAEDFIFDPKTNTKKTTSIIKAANDIITDEARKTALQDNTAYIGSGVGKGDSIFDGNDENAEKNFGTVADNTLVDVADKYLQVNIYAHIEGSGGITHNFFSGAGYYKFRIETVGNASEFHYEIKACHNGTNVIKEGEWCASGAINISQTFDTMKQAVEYVLAVYKAGTGGANAFDFKGNSITFTIDYRVFDLAGNASEYVRKGVLIAGFTSNIVVNTPSGVSQVASFEVAQNANMASVLNQFSVGTATGANLKYGERIVQTVYYNGEVIASRQAYDPNTLSTLDTSVPGSYRIVYSVERRDGLEFIEGNSVELNVTVKPNVAEVSNGNINYIHVIVIAVGIVTVGLAALFLELKKKQRN